MTYPSPVSLRDVVFCWRLSHLLPQFLVADGVRPVNLENPSNAGIDENLDSLQGGDSYSPGLSSIKQGRLHDSVEDLILVLNLRYEEATFVFLIWTLTSASVPPFISTMLPGYVKLSISSSASPPMMGFSLTSLTFRILLFPLWTLMPKHAELTPTVLVFSCICCWVCERTARLSAKSRSSNSVQSVHWMLFHLWAVDIFMTQSIVRRSMKGDSKHHSSPHFKGVGELLSMDPRETGSRGHICTGQLTLQFEYVVPGPNDPWSGHSSIMTNYFSRK